MASLERGDACVSMKRRPGSCSRLYAALEHLYASVGSLEQRMAIAEQSIAGLAARQDGLPAQESEYAREMRKVRREIEAVVPEAVKIVGFAKRAGLYVVNLESSEVAYISRAMRAIDDLPDWVRRCWSSTMNVRRRPLRRV